MPTKKRILEKAREILKEDHAKEKGDAPGRPKGDAPKRAKRAAKRSHPKKVK